MLYILGIFLVLYVVWPQFRNVVSGYVAGTGYWLGTQWTNHRTILIISLLIIWLLPVATLLFIGWFANSLTSAIIFLVVFPFWIAGSIRSGLESLRALATGKVAPPRPKAGIVRSFLALVLIIAAANIVFGLWSPELKDATNTWTFYKKKDLAISVHKSTSKMESVRGTEAIITEDATAFIGASNEFLAYLNKGDEILVPDVKNIEKAGPNGEGYIWVMIKNNHRQFLNGKAGKVPIRLIEYKSDLPNPAPASVPAPPAEKKVEEKMAVEKTWKFSFQHPRFGGSREYTVTKMKKTDESIWAEVKGPETFFLNGSSPDGGIYTGKYFQGGWERGEFEFDFSKDPSCGKGWHLDANHVKDEGWIPTSLCKK